MTLHKSIEQYIHAAPDLKVAFIGHTDDDILAIIDRKLQPQNGSIDAFIYDVEPKPLDCLDVKMMADYSKSFRSIAREYELLILNDTVDAPLKQDVLMKNAFKALENSGNLLIICSSRGSLQEYLDTFGFVAVNEIETDDENRVLISAKKMHGWGHGL